MIPVELQVIASGLRAIAEEMGAVLVRSAFSANIKERRDCSTALFDERGRMVTQAEHIPVHLGAMPEAVAAVIAQDPAPSEPWIVNDPYAGGTHLPDLTIVTRTALGFAVTRAHHADVGGSEPGSLPAGSRTLADEGVVIPPTRLDEATIDALAQLRDPRFFYLVVGDGPDRDAIAAYAAERGVSGQVRMLGFVDQEDLPLLYSAADVAVLVARGSAGFGEAVPLGLIEAAACGVPFVCGNQDGSPEAISEARPNGIAIDPDRPEALAAALRQLADRPALAKAMGENGKWMVDETFRFEKFTERLAHLMWRHLGVARLPAGERTLATSPRG